MSAHDFILKVLRQPFLPVWFALTIMVALSTAWIISRARAQFQRVPADVTAEPRSLLSGGPWLTLGMFCLFFLGYVALIFVWEDFAYYDDSQFTLYSLKGFNFPPPVWVDSGRFFPLGFQEFNIIGRLSHNVDAYQALSVLQLLFVCAILLSLDRDLSLRARVALAACVLLSPAVTISFGGLIYSERNIIFWLLCLLFFLKRFDQKQSILAALAAIICAQFMLYYKESAFLLLWGLAAGRLVMRCWNTEKSGWNFQRLRETSSRLDFCLGALGFIFLVCYAATMFRHTRLQYVQQQSLPELQVLSLYLKMDLLAWLLVVVVAIRTFLIWKRKIVPSPFWEGLAWGAAAYLASFLCLRMFSPYYLAPVDLIAVLYLGRLAVLSWQRQPAYGRFAIAGALCVILVQNISLSTFREFERKNLIHAKSEMASVIQAEFQHHGGSAMRLFFPFANRYVTMEFGAYLSYRGLQMEETDDKSVDKHHVVIVSRAMQSDGKIEDYRDIIGHAGQNPQPGDLVIVLPDDDISDAGAAPYLHGGNELFLYEPNNRFPRWLWSFMKPLHFVSPEFQREPLPDHWLDASVTVWKGSQGLSTRAVTP
jgi:hypothetical protein